MCVETRCTNMCGREWPDGGCGPRGGHNDTHPPRGWVGVVARAAPNTTRQRAGGGTHGAAWARQPHSPRGAPRHAPPPVVVGLWGGCWTPPPPTRGRAAGSVVAGGRPPTPDAATYAGAPGWAVRPVCGEGFFRPYLPLSPRSGPSSPYRPGNLSRAQPVDDSHPQWAGLSSQAPARPFDSTPPPSPANAVTPLWHRSHFHPLTSFPATHVFVAIPCGCARCVWSRPQTSELAGPAPPTSRI